MPVTDHELREALGADSLLRRPWPYRASLPMEELDLQGRRLLLKDLSSPADLQRPRLAPDPRREIAVYRDVLAPLAVDGTARVAAADETAGRWLVLLPRQKQQANPWRCWNWFDARTAAGDGEAAIVFAQIESAVRRYRADPHRVVVAGMSAGGALAAVMGVRS